MERKELFKIIDVLKEQINDAINMRQEEIRGANFALERLKKLIPKDSNQVERVVSLAASSSGAKSEQTCENCKYFRQEHEQDRYEHRGQCILLSDKDDSEQIKDCSSWADGISEDGGLVISYFSCHQTFGCNQFEQK